MSWLKCTSTFHLAHWMTQRRLGKRYLTSYTQYVTNFKTRQSKTGKSLWGTLNGKFLSCLFLFCKMNADRTSNANAMICHLCKCSLIFPITQAATACLTLFNFTFIRKTHGTENVDFLKFTLLSVFNELLMQYHFVMSYNSNSWFRRK